MEGRRGAGKAAVCVRGWGGGDRHFHLSAPGAILRAGGWCSGRPLPSTWRLLVGILLLLAVVVWDIDSKTAAWCACFRPRSTESPLICPEEGMMRCALLT